MYKKTGRGAKTPLPTEVISNIKKLYQSAARSRRTGRSSRIGRSPRSTILAPPSQIPVTVLALQATPRAVKGRTAKSSTQVHRGSPKTRLPSHPQGHGEQLVEHVSFTLLVIFYFLSKKNQKLRVIPLRRTNCPESEPARHPVLSVTKLVPRL